MLMLINFPNEKFGKDPMLPWQKLHLLKKPTKRWAHVFPFRIFRYFSIEGGFKKNDLT